MSSTGLVGVLCAAALAPVLAAAAGAGAVMVAGVGVLGSVGANVLSDVVATAIEALRGAGRGSTRDDLEREVAAAIERVLDVGDQRARVLRREVAAVLQETGAVAAALEAAVDVGDPSVQVELARALTAVTAEFDEFGFVLAEVREAAGTILETLRRQDAERRADRSRAHDSAVQLRLVREELAVIERRTRPRATPDTGSETAVAWVGCPYRGLLPFEEDHAAIFYGRERLTAELVTTLATRLTGLGMLVVTGASGAGKSSLLRAGLLPAVARGSLVDQSSRWPRVVFTPTRTPLDELATQVAAISGIDVTTVRPNLAEAPDQAHLMVRQALLAGGDEAASDRPARRVLLVVDQFEEIFTLAGDGTDGAAQRGAFVAALHAAGGTAAGPHGEPPALVVLGVRGDFWDRCASYPQLVHALQAGPFVVGPMTEPELRRAITGPAVAAGLHLERGLAESILAELRGVHGPDVGSLPLLSQAMLVTWEHRTEEGLLTSRGYGLSGGIAHAVQASAEAAYSHLSEGQRVAARTVLRRLTVVAPDGQLARRRLVRADLYPPGRDADNADVDAVLDAFAARRLVILNDGTVEIAHDALLRAWPRLRGWLDSDIADLALYGQLTDDATAWAGNNHDSSFLYRGGQLAVATQAAARWRAAADRYPPLTQAAAEFIAASRRHHRQRVAARRGVIAAIVALLLLASTTAVILQRRTDELGRQLRTNAAQILAARSQEQARTEPDTAVLMAVAAYRSSPDPAVAANLAGEYLRYRSSTRLLGADVGDVEEVYVSADGTVVAALGARGQVAIWRPDRQPVVPRVVGEHLVSAALSPDGSLVAGSTSTGRIAVWRADGTSVILQQDGQPANGGSLRFDPTGRRLLANLLRQGLVVWDVGQRQAVPLPPGLVGQFTTFVSGVWFGPDANNVVVATDAGLTQWHLPTGRATPVSPLDDGSFASVSGDGRTAITCTGRTQVRWSLDPIRERDRRPGSDGLCGTWLPDPGGNVMMTDGTSEKGNVVGTADHPRAVLSLLDLRTGFTASPIVPTGSAITRGAKLATIRDGTRAVVPVGAAVAVTDVGAKDFTPFNTELAARRSGPVFTADHTRAVLVDNASGPGLRLWDTDSGRELARAGDRDGPVLGFLNEDRTLVALDASWEHLVLREVPSLRITARLPVPVAPGVTRARASQITAPFNSFCAADTSAPGTIAASYGGLITRYDVTSGTQIGEPIRPWRTTEERDRLARSRFCSVRPGTNEMALDVNREIIQTWDLDRGEPVRTLDPPDLRAIADISFSSDGRLLAILDVESSLQVWDVERRRPVTVAQRVSEPSARLRIAGFPASDRVVVDTGSASIVWDLRRRAAVASFDMGTVDDVAVSPDGSTLAFVANDRLSRIPLDPSRWIDRLCAAAGRDLSDIERRTLPPGSSTERIC